MIHIKSATCSDFSPFARKRLCIIPDNEGFTMVELIVVMAILAVLTLLAIPSYDLLTNRARTTGAIEEIRSIEKTIIAWSTDNGGALPENLTKLGSSLPTSKDPWGRDYEYHLISDPAYMTPRVFGVDPVNTDYDLFSRGKDGHTDPDISVDAAQQNILRINDGQWVGEVSAITGGLL